MYRDQTEGQAIYDATMLADDAFLARAVWLMRHRYATDGAGHDPAYRARVDAEAAAHGHERPTLGDLVTVWWREREVTDATP